MNGWSLMLALMTDVIDGVLKCNEGLAAGKRPSSPSSEAWSIVSIFSSNPARRNTIRETRFSLFAYCSFKVPYNTPTSAGQSPMPWCLHGSGLQSSLSFWIELSTQLYCKSRNDPCFVPLTIFWHMVRFDDRRRNGDQSSALRMIVGGRLLATGSSLL